MAIAPAIPWAKRVLALLPDDVWLNPHEPSKHAESG